MNRGVDPNLSDAALDSLDDGLLVLDLDLTVRRCNLPFRRMFGVNPEDVYGRPLLHISDGVLNVPEVRQGVREVLLGRKRLDVDLSWRRDSSAAVSIRMKGRRIGKLPNLLLAFRDVSSEIQVREQQKLRLSEAEHRIKNLLTLVHSIARGSIRHASDLREFELSFLPRLAALERANRLADDDSGGATELKSLLETELLAHAWDEDPRISLRGPPVMVSGQESRAISLLVHELATNAVKYGALASDTGKLDIQWQVEQRSSSQMLFVEWRESGAGLPDGDPEEGFGSQLIRHSIETMPGGTVDLHFGNDGLVCTCGLRLPKVLPSSAQAPATPKSGAAYQVRPPQRKLGNGGDRGQTADRNGHERQHSVRDRADEHVGGGKNEQV